MRLASELAPEPSNEAEYRALLALLAMAAKHQAFDLLICGDSMLVLMQVVAESAYWYGLVIIILSWRHRTIFLPGLPVMLK